MKMISIPAAMKIAGFSSPNALHHWADFYNNRADEKPILRVGKRFDADSLEAALEVWDLRRGSAAMEANQ